MNGNYERESESLGPARNSHLGPGLHTSGSLFAVSLAAVYLTLLLSPFIGEPGVLFSGSPWSHVSVLRHQN